MVDGVVVNEGVCEGGRVGVSLGGTLGVFDGVGVKGVVSDAMAATRSAALTVRSKLRSQPAFASKISEITCVTAGCPEQSEVTVAVLADHLRGPRPAREDAPPIFTPKIVPARQNATTSVCSRVFRQAPILSDGRYCRMIFWSTSVARAGRPIRRFASSGSYRLQGIDPLRHGNTPAAAPRCGRGCDGYLPPWRRPGRVGVRRSPHGECRARPSE